MLASIIANLQNLPEEIRPPMVKIDRGGGGPLWGPGYDIIDIMAAVQSFPEVAGEDQVARAVRRLRWIGEALPKIKEAREKREAAAFLAGATVADAAAEERHQAAQVAAEDRRRLVDQLKIEQLVQIVDEVRGTVATPAMPAPVPRQRGSGSGTSALSAAILVGLGVAIGLGIARSSRPSRSRASRAFV